MLWHCTLEVYQFNKLPMRIAESMLIYPTNHGMVWCQTYHNCLLYHRKKKWNECWKYWCFDLRLYLIIYWIYLFTPLLVQKVVPLNKRWIFLVWPATFKRTDSPIQNHQNSLHAAFGILPQPPLFLPSSCSTCLFKHLAHWKFQSIALEPKILCKRWRWAFHTIFSSLLYHFWT